jgi:hypothetical protein
VARLQRADGEEARGETEIMHRDPVKRGLVGGARGPARWSSYRFYLLGEPGPVRVNEGWGRISFRARGGHKRG